MGFCRNAFVVWLTAFASKPAPTDLRSLKVCGCCPDQWILRTPKVAGVARTNGFRVGQRLSGLREAVGARLPANGVLPQRICRLAHRVRQQAGSYRFAFAEGCRCCPDQWIWRTPKAAGTALSSCRSALAREWGFAATHLLSGSPRSPASRLLQIRVRGRLPVLPGSTDFAYVEGCGCCPDQWILRTPKVAGVARINGFRVRRRLPGWRDQL
jgi:hypothetical protein